MPTSRRLLVFVGITYAIQVAAAFYCHIVPFAEREKNAKRYVIRRGHFPETLIPGFGAIYFILVDVTVYDVSGRDVGRRIFHVIADLYEAYPGVWPEQEKKLTRNESANSTEVLEKQKQKLAEQDAKIAENQAALDRAARALDAR